MTHDNGKESSTSVAPAQYYKYIIVSNRSMRVIQVAHALVF